jgi:tRNA pseudouridine38-40 synthase
MRNIRMTLEYDGTAYAGWQRQKNGLSIQQVLEEKIAV